jgi:hypothetical protein
MKTTKLKRVSDYWSAETTRHIHSFKVDHTDGLINCISWYDGETKIEVSNMELRAIISIIKDGKYRLSDVEGGENDN